MRKTSVTDGRTDRRTECKPIVPPGFTGGGLKSAKPIVPPGFTGGGLKRM